MSWQINFEPEAEDDLLHLDRAVNERVLTKLAWVEENFPNITPIPLSYTLAGVFKLQVGDYRVLYEIKQKEHLINIVAAGHRSKVYVNFQQRWNR
ncbi:MAG: type II toxin-antitoxin system RelE/ParE family toxin [Patescibacteria group bacterium]